MTVLEDIRDETQRLRKQINTERRWRWAISAVIILTIISGLRVEQIRRNEDRREDRRTQEETRSTCVATNEARTTIREAFDILIDASLRDVPADDPRHARAQDFTNRIAEALPVRDCG